MVTTNRNQERNIIVGGVITNKQKLREKIEKDKQSDLGIALLWILGLFILSKIFKDFDSDILEYICIGLILFLKGVKVVMLDVIQTYVYPYIDSKEDNKEDK